MGGLVGSILGEDPEVNWDNCSSFAGKTWCFISYVCLRSIPAKGVLPGWGTIQATRHTVGSGGGGGWVGALCFVSGKASAAAATADDYDGWGNGRNHRTEL